MWWHMRRNPDFVFRRNRRAHLNQQGRQFSRLLEAEVCTSAVVMLDTPCSKVVWRVLATNSIYQFPLHFPSRASLCAITFQLYSTSIDILFTWITSQIHIIATLATAHWWITFHIRFIAIFVNYHWIDSHTPCSSSLLVITVNLRAAENFCTGITLLRRTPQNITLTNVANFAKTYHHTLFQDATLRMLVSLLSHKFAYLP
jgi:hypothetical protein